MSYNHIAKGIQQISIWCGGRWFRSRSWSRCWGSRLWSRRWSWTWRLWRHRILWLLLDLVLPVFQAIRLAQCCKVRNKATATDPFIPDSTGPPSDAYNWCNHLLMPQYNHSIPLQHKMRNHTKLQIFHYEVSVHLVATDSDTAQVLNDRGQDSVS